MSSQVVRNSLNPGEVRLEPIDERAVCVMHVQLTSHKYLAAQGLGRYSSLQLQSEPQIYHQHAGLFFVSVTPVVLKEVQYACCKSRDDA